MRAGALALLVCWVLGCGDCGQRQSTHATSSEQTAALDREAPVEPSGPAEGEPAAAPSQAKPAQAAYPRPGWSAVSLQDEVPICVFADYEEHAKAEFVEQVEKQALRANSSVVIGAYAAWCVNEACDDQPSLQCSVDRDGNTLVVRSRYWGGRKDGAECKDVVCRPITAGCQSPALEPGVYTVEHGDVRFELRVPGVLRDPCFGTEPRPPPGR